MSACFTKNWSASSFVFLILYCQCSCSSVLQCEDVILYQLVTLVLTLVVILILVVILVLTLVVILISLVAEMLILILIVILVVILVITRNILQHISELGYERLPLYDCVLSRLSSVRNAAKVAISITIS